MRWTVQVDGDNVVIQNRHGATYRVPTRGANGVRIVPLDALTERMFSQVGRYTP
jgi:hypothetical protein